MGKGATDDGGCLNQNVRARSVTKRTGQPHMGCFDRKYKRNNEPTHHSQKECRDRKWVEAYAGHAFGCSTHSEFHSAWRSAAGSVLSMFAFAVVAVVAALDHPSRKEAQTAA